MLAKFLTITCFLGTTVSALSESGILEIYPMPTQNGAIARRVFTDEHKRPIRAICYRAKDFSKAQKDESDLIPYETLLYSYDEHGREVWMGEYSPELIPRRSLETLYDAAGKLLTRQWRDSDGIVRYQMRYENGRTVSHLYFDDMGKHLIGISGKNPLDIDLFSGWGKALDGLACGMAINRNQGKLKDLRFHVTVRNLTMSSRKVITCLPYQEIKVGLRDASGHLVQEDTEHIRQRDKELREMNHGTNENVQTIPPNESMIFNGGYDLKEWYPSLPAGTYTLTVRRRADGPDFTLVANSLQLQVVADEPH